MSARSVHGCELWIAALAMTGALYACGHGAAQPSVPADARRVHRDSFGRFHALVIGVRDYPTKVTNRVVGSALNDAEALSRTLREDYDFEVVPLANPSAAEILDALTQLHSEPTRDSLLVYFSGHGESAHVAGARVPVREGGYWLASDAAETLSEAELSDASGRSQLSRGWISRALIAKQLAATGHRHVIVIDDSCFAGATKSVTLPEEGARVAREPRYVPSHLDGAKIGQRRARKWLSAGGEELVRPSADAYSLFTTYLLHALEQNETVESGTALFAEIRDRMSHNREQQLPDYFHVAGARDEGGDFLFVKKTYSEEEIDVGSARFVVRVVGSRKNVDEARSDAIKNLVLAQLISTAEVVPPELKARKLELLISFSKPNTLVMTVYDPEQGQLLATVSQTLEEGAEALRGNVESALLNVRSQAHVELESKYVSADTVKRALVAQRSHAYELSATASVSAYTDFGDQRWLNDPAYGVQVGTAGYLKPWLLIGVRIGFDQTLSHSSSDAFVGDVDDGTYADNRWTGALLLTTWSGLATATLRMSHGLVLPFACIGAGIAYYDLELGDERLEPATPRDTSPFNLIRRRSDTSALAPLVAAGGGVTYVFSEHLSFVFRAELFKGFHDLSVRSRIEGVAQVKEVENDFQTIQGVSMQGGVALLL